MLRDQASGNHVRLFHRLQLFGNVFAQRLHPAEGVWKLFSYRRRRARLTDQLSLADQAGANVANRAQKSPSRP
jgi:hypothetical protein